MSECQHDWRFQFVVYTHIKDLKRTYEDRYYCTKCLELQDRNKRNYGTIDSDPLPGTMPKGDR